VETPRGLVAAWFAGTHEKNPDVGIWVSRHVDGGWTLPVEVLTGVQHASLRYPCWNPVLFQQPDGPLHLFSKVGPTPSTWWGVHQVSTDHGATWSQPMRLPEEIDGPVRNKPVLLDDGTLLCGSSTEYDGWRVHFELTKDFGKTWERVGPINDGRGFGAIQPTILIHRHTRENGGGPVRLQALCRHQQSKGILSTWSDDGGRTWSPLELTSLPNPNSGIDAVSLVDGRQLLIYNHTPKGRSPLNLALSADGRVWNPTYVLESDKGEYSYPAIIQSSDGLVHMTYTWKRRLVKHVVVDPAKLQTQP
jgi:predicted neuraminidase